jgi:hypothetical protein
MRIKSASRSERAAVRLMDDPSACAWGMAPGAAGDLVIYGLGDRLVMVDVSIRSPLATTARTRMTQAMNNRPMNADGSPKPGIVQSFLYQQRRSKQLIYKKHMQKAMRRAGRELPDSFELHDPLAMLDLKFVAAIVTPLGNLDSQFDDLLRKIALHSVKLFCDSLPAHPPLHVHRQMVLQYRHRYRAIIHVSIVKAIAQSFSSYSRQKDTAASAALGGSSPLRNPNSPRTRPTTMADTVNSADSESESGSPYASDTDPPLKYAALSITRSRVEPTSHNSTTQHRSRPSSSMPHPRCSTAITATGMQSSTAPSQPSNTHSTSDTARHNHVSAASVDPHAERVNSSAPRLDTAPHNPRGAPSRSRVGELINSTAPPEGVSGVY